MTEREAPIGPMPSAIHLIGLPTDRNSSFVCGVALGSHAIRAAKLVCERAARLHVNNQEQQP